MSLEPLANGDVNIEGTVGTGFQWFRMLTVLCPLTMFLIQREVFLLALDTGWVEVKDRDDSASGT